MAAHALTVEAANTKAKVEEQQRQLDMKERSVIEQRVQLARDRQAWAGKAGPRGRCEQCARNRKLLDEVTQQLASQGSAVLQPHLLQQPAAVNKLPHAASQVMLSY